MKTSILFAVLSAGLIAAAVPAAAAVVVSVEGMGTVCKQVVGTRQNDILNCTSSGGVAMTGTITFNRIGVPDTNLPGLAAGENWISTSFQLNWSGEDAGSYISTRLANETAFSASALTQDDYTSGFDDPVSDLLQATFTSQSVSDIVDFERQFSRNAADLSMGAVETPWLQNLDFPFDAGLAFGTAAFNVVTFSDEAFTLSFEDPDETKITWVRPGSVNGSFLLTSYQVVEVPEPGTLALALAGGLGLLLRRRAKLRAEPGE